MSEIANYLAKQKKRENARVTLDEALFNQRFSRYAFFRLRYFSLNYFLELMIHIVEFFFLIMTFPKQLVVLFIFMRVLSLLINGYWWGALEALRARVRICFSLNKIVKLQKEIGCWILLSCVLAGFILMLGIIGVVLACYYLESNILTLALIYILSITLISITQIILRTYHSGIFALQRVYRPLWTILMPNIINILLVSILWLPLGIHSLPLALLVSAIANCLITIKFTRFAYRNNNIQIMFSKNKFLWLRFLKSLLDWEGFLAGVAFLFIKLDALFILLFLSLVGEYQILLTVYLINPIIRFGYDWTRIFYYDYKKIGAGAFLSIQHHFDRHLFKLALIMGLICYGLSVITLLLFSNLTLGFWALSILPLFILHATLGLLQLRAYSNHRYLDVMVSSVIMLLGVLYLALMSTTLNIALIIMLLSFILANAYLLKSHLKIVKTGDYFYQSEPFFLWLNALKKIKSDLILAKIKLDFHHTKTNRIFVDSLLSNRLGKYGKVCLCDNEIYFYCDKKKDLINIAWLTLNLPGLAYHYETFNIVAPGAVVLKNAITNHFFTHLLISSKTISQEDLFAYYEKHFKDGMIIKIKDNIALPKFDFPVLSTIKSGLRSLKLYNTYKPQFSSLCANGQIQYLFLIDAFTESHKIKTWQTLLWRYQLQNL